MCRSICVGTMDLKGNLIAVGSVTACVGLVGLVESVDLSRNLLAAINPLIVVMSAKVFAGDLVFEVAGEVRELCIGFSSHGQMNHFDDDDDDDDVTTRALLDTNSGGTTLGGRACGRRLKIAVYGLQGEGSSCGG
jgi:hypothetical protein